MSRALTRYITIPKLVKGQTPRKAVLVQGWATSVQHFRKVFFLHLNDGTGPELLQAVVDKGLCSKVNVGSAVQVWGDWVASQGKQQAMELMATSCRVLGIKEEKMLDANIDLLRQNVHLRAKDPGFAAVLRLASHLTFFSHQFFMEDGFHHVTAPTTSRNDCEGAGQTFFVQASNTENFFGGKDVIHLPVSSQLHLEALSIAIPKVYTIGTAFRAEKSEDSQHLAEFRMLEAECAFMDSVDDLCTLVETYLKTMCTKLLPLQNELEASKQFCGMHETGLLKTLSVDKEIPRITFVEAVAILQRRGEPRGTSLRPLGRLEELALIAEFGGPLFITHFPSEAKPFYMKRTEDGEKAECFDLLAPIVGELAGGSVRDEDFERMKSRLPESTLSKLDWYFDLRAQGYPGSAGFGLGVERLVQTLLGIPNIRDATPFPRWYQRCQC